MKDSSERFKEKYTFKKPCCIDGEPDAQTVWIKIGGQSFQLDGYQDDEESADWYRHMIGKALDEFLKIEKSNPKNT